MFIMLEFVQKLNCNFFIMVSKRAELKILTILFFQYSTAVFTFVSLRMVKLLDFVMGKLAISIIASNCTFYMRIIESRRITPSISICMKESTTSIFTIIMMLKLTVDRLKCL